MQRKSFSSIRSIHYRKLFRLMPALLQTIGCVRTNGALSGYQPSSTPRDCANDPAVTSAREGRRGGPERNQRRPRLPIGTRVGQDAIF